MRGNAEIANDGTSHKRGAFVGRGNALPTSPLQSYLGCVIRRSPLTPADRYRAYAAQCRAKANNESNDRAKGDWEALAQDYVRLAEQAERRDKFDVVYETTLLTSRRPRVRP
jgi:hypothetical protein